MILQAPEGTLFGIEEASHIVYKNIRYGHAIRFQKPVPYSHFEQYGVTSEVVSLSSVPTIACPQLIDTASEQIFGFDAYSHINMQEDCQVLTVTCPKNNSSRSKLPVMVWIHGGGYVSGFGDFAGYDPSHLVEEHAVIVVSITYRLGIFGFLGGYQNIPPNLGLFDIQLALQWIKKHIALFQGDSENITLFGQSAGGDIIANLMLSNDFEGLFQKAILQSAPFGLSKNKQKVTDKLIEVGLNEDLSGSVESLLEVQKKMTKNAQGLGFASGMPFGVQYHAAPLPDEKDIEAIWAEHAASYEILVGNTYQETSFFLPFLKTLTPWLALPVLGALFEPLFIRSTTKLVYETGTRQLYKKLLASGGKIMKYRLSFGKKARGLGSAHTIELPLLFWNPPIWGQSLLLKEMDATDIENAGKTIRSIWTDFAKYGLPDHNFSDASITLSGKKRTK